MWREGRREFLPDGGARQSEARDITDHGPIVGEVKDFISGGRSHPARWRHRYRLTPVR